MGGSRVCFCARAVDVVLGGSGGLSASRFAYGIANGVVSPVYYTSGRKERACALSTYRALG